VYSGIGSILILKVHGIYDISLGLFITAKDLVSFRPNLYL